MILILEKNISDDLKSHLRGLLFEKGCIVREMNDAGQSVIGILGKGSQDASFFNNLPGVEKVIPIERPFKLVSRQWHPKESHVTVGPVVVGGERIIVVAGPCAVESLQQAMTIAKKVKRYGATIFRGGAYKPRTSPYSFQGLEEEGLKILAKVRDETGLPILTEITSPTQVEVMAKYVDAVQVGARNMQNFELLKCVGRLKKPVVLKRGLASTIEEWLMSAEYILSEGNDQVILCERGIRTFEPYTRNTLDLSAIPILKKLTHLPVLVDPSHATGIREKVPPMARAGIAAGADALMVEVHHDPSQALSDGPQSLYPRQFGQLMRDIYVIAPVVGKQLDFSYLEKAAKIEPQGTAKKRALLKVAFLGEIGTYSHKACRQYFGDQMTLAPMMTYRSIFKAVKSKEVDYAMVPLENSLSGSMHENYDLLMQYDLKIIGEITLRIIHHLIGQPEATIGDIKRVISMAPTIQQCRQFLDHYPEWEIVTANTTASAVREVSQTKNVSDAAIASKEAAKLFKMKMIEEGIETNPRNFTRYAVIAVSSDDRQKCNKSALVFSVGNQPGALYEVLKIFQEASINLVKLESRPIHGKPWQYLFYSDLEVDVSAPQFEPVIKAINDKTEVFKILGCYSV
jgi:3-deoxy-7-phosphoheptulonate synthase